MASRLKIPWSTLEIDWLSQRRRTLIQGMEKAGLLDIAPQRQEPVPGSWLVAWDGGGPEKETPAAADCQGAYAWAAVAPDHRTMTAEGGGPLAGPGNPAFEEWDFDMFQEGAIGGNRGLSATAPPGGSSDAGSFTSELTAGLKFFQYLWVYSSTPNTTAYHICQSGHLTVIFDQGSAAEIARGSQFSKAQGVLALLLRRVGHLLARLGLTIHHYWIHSHQGTEHWLVDLNRFVDQRVTFARKGSVPWLVEGTLALDS